MDSGDSGSDFDPPNSSDDEEEEDDDYSDDVDPSEVVALRQEARQHGSKNQEAEESVSEKKMVPTLYHLTCPMLSSMPESGPQRIMDLYRLEMTITRNQRRDLGTLPDKTRITRRRMKHRRRTF